ncbi:sugar transferase%2C PEP-CTERM/EpsH1 system associated [Bordetella ansorpii]|uniref:Sugar transferase, PEP-CTERM/EpsH1 system associated n=2 Tax=Bordetella ansorpii TaxID=288768 RepID=A0A157R1E4_9BORD|nr:sugar transferase%2C PEP-CTERM/EpsH1 system associated [Bordetella ansorpii]
MQVTVISPNGLQELSGGGLYLRSLVQGLAEAAPVRAVRVLSKRMTGASAGYRHPQIQQIEFAKNRLLDVAARVLLRPTFLGLYHRAIARHCADADVVFLHNTRCGGIMRMLRARYPDKKFVMVSDNVEADLHDQRSAGKSGLRRLLAGIESHAVRGAEACCRSADALTFITRTDAELYARMFGPVTRQAVLPITVKAPDAGVQAAAPTRPTVLFTGHFGFPPNVDSLRIFVRVAQAVNQGRAEHERIAFVAAGANLGKLALDDAPGLTCHDSPSVAQMDLLFRSATAYLAPVKWGSGMKTKVAEALSYSLAVVALPNAGVGYEALQEDATLSRALDVVGDEADLPTRTLACLQHAPSDSRAIAWQAYSQFYSTASQARRLEAILKQLGA